MNTYWKVDTYATVFYYRFVHKLIKKNNGEPSWSVGEVKVWEYRYVFVWCPFYVGYTTH